MTTITMICDVQVDLSEISNDAFRKELHLRDEIVDGLKEEFREEIEAGVTLANFETDDLIKELRQRHADDAAGAIERIYRAIADGRNADALDEMFEIFPKEGLAPPSTEFAVADLISARKGSSNVRN